MKWGVTLLWDMGPTIMNQASLGGVVSPPNCTVDGGTYGVCHMFEDWMSVELLLEGLHHH